MTKLSLVACTLQSLLVVASYGKNEFEIARFSKANAVENVSGEVKICLECYRLPRKDAQILFLDPKTKPSVKDSMLKVHAAIEAKKDGYALIATGAIVSQSGTTPTTMENMEEVIYPYRYVGDGLAEKPVVFEETCGLSLISAYPFSVSTEAENQPVVITPKAGSKHQIIYKDTIAAMTEAKRLGIKLLTPRDFDMQPVGFRFEMASVLEKDQKSLHIIVWPEFVRLEGWTMNKGAIRPVFDKHKFRKDSKLQSGEAVVVGGWTPRHENLAPGADLIEIIVMAADIVQ